MTEGFARFADVNRVCKANQRELIAATGIAFKTLIAVRDELIARRLIVRYKHAYRGKRDWYQLLDPKDAAAEQRRDRRERRRAEQYEGEDRLLPLPLSPTPD
ncbi:MAG: hypothetical protein WAJ85_01655 [Candidatus Baltobacteraceae bacterium]